MTSYDSYALATIPRTKDGDKLAALVAHGGTLVAWFFAPLVVYLLKRHESRWAEHQALQSLLWSLAGTLVSAATCGLAIPLFLAFHLYAAYKILKGEEYDYPIVGDVARSVVYESE